MSDFEELKDLLMEELDAAEDLFRASTEDKVRFGEITKDDLADMMEECDAWTPEGVQIFHRHVLSKHLTEINDIFDEILTEQTSALVPLTLSSLMSVQEDFSPEGAFVKVLDTFGLSAHIAYESYLKNHL